MMFEDNIRSITEVRSLLSRTVIYTQRQIDKVDSARGMLGPEFIATQDRLEEARGSLANALTSLVNASEGLREHSRLLIGWGIQAEARINPVVDK